MRSTQRLIGLTAVTLSLAVLAVGAIQATAEAQQGQTTITAASSQPAAPVGVRPPPQNPPAAKPPIGPPAPLEASAAQPRKPTPAAPQPTVQLKPGEVPGIKFDTPTYDFGRIPAGEQVLHDFWFTNTGNGPLEIVSVKPS